VKSVIGEFSSGMSKCLNKGLQSDLGAPSSGSGNETHLITLRKRVSEQLHLHGNEYT